MSKKNNETSAKVSGIKAGEPITVEAATRAEAKVKLSELREKAKAEGLTKAGGGFIQFVRKHYLDTGSFIAVITFKK